MKLHRVTQVIYNEWDDLAEKVNRESVLRMLRFATMKSSTERRLRRRCSVADTLIKLMQFLQKSGCRIELETA